MTSKHLYFKLWKEDLKRKLWAAALLALAFFFCIPVPMAMVLPNYKITEYVTQAQVILRRTNNVRYMLGFGSSYPIVTMLLFVAAVVMGITTFSYLHNKKQVDFYHSLPVKRSLWFWVNISTGIFLPAMIYFAAVVLTLLVGMLNGVFPGAVLGTATTGFLLNMLYYTLTYGTVILAMMLTGTKIAAILGSAVLFGFFPIVSLLSVSYYSAFFQTYYSSTPNFLARSFLKLSPISAIVMAMEEIHPVRIISVLAVILLLGAFVFFLYQKRPSEAAGKTMAFRYSKGIIKVPLVLAFGCAGGLFFYSIQPSLGWTIFGNIVGVVLSHCIIEVIYWGDFKKVFCHEKTLAVCLFVSLAVLLSFYFDLFKFDAYVPRENQIAYASVDFNKDSWVYSMNYDNDLYMVNDILHQGKIEDTASVLTLVNEAIRQMEIEERKGDEGWEQLRVQKEYSQRFRMDVCYTLKNRRKVYRSYIFYIDPVLEVADKIYTETAYKKALFPGLCLDASAAENIVYRGWNDNIHHLDGSKEQREAVLKAYQEEMTAMNFTRRKTENPFGEILLISSENIEKIEKRRDAEDDELIHYQWNWYNGYYYPIYPSFTKTIQALKDCGVELDELFTAEDVEEIMISGYGPFTDEEMEHDVIGVEWAKSADVSDEDLLCQISYDNVEDIEKILPFYLYNENGWKNGMAETDGYLTVVVKLKRRGNREIRGAFKPNEVPEFVIQDLSAMDEELKKIKQEE